MKISKKEIGGDGLVGHLITNAISSNIDIIDQIEKKGYANVKLMINGHEFDIEKFCEHWQTQVSDMIDRRATRMAEERFDKVRKKMLDYESRIMQAFDEIREE